MRKQLSIRITPEALVRLESRAREAQRLAGVPVSPAGLAAALLHGALGLGPDGTAPDPVLPGPSGLDVLDLGLRAFERGERLDAPEAPAAPPSPEDPIVSCPTCKATDIRKGQTAGVYTCSACGAVWQKAREHDQGDEQETAEQLRARALAYAREHYSPGNLPEREATARKRVEAWAEDLGERFPSLGSETIRAILHEAGVAQELLEAPAPHGGARRPAAEVVDSFTSLRRKAVEDRPGIIAGWVSTLREQCGLSEREARIALFHERRRLDLRHEETGLDRPKKARRRRK